MLYCQQLSSSLVISNQSQANQSVVSPNSLCLFIFHIIQNNKNKATIVKKDKAKRLPLILDIKVLQLLHTEAFESLELTQLAQLETQLQQELKDYEDEQPIQIRNLLSRLLSFSATKNCSKCYLLQLEQGFIKIQKNKIIIKMLFKIKMYVQ
ncbi:hypothetical protein ABPG72_009581 [Tetrahymena utriculariae]